MSEPDRAPSPAEKAPPLYQNWVSLLGIIIAASSFFAVLSLIAIDIGSGGGTPYLGILTYLVAPAFLVTGLVLIVGGMLVERRRRRKLAPGEIPKHPRIDLNNPRHRNGFIVASIVAFVFLLATAFGSYQTYHFTESVTFCGKTCHTLMIPEYTAYQHSPHARVTCVQCHIGPGAGWFVKSKLSGTYQVYATVFNKYPKPIPTPIKNLRPAQETCEQCHWPQKFYGNAERINTHFLNDEVNTRWTIRLLMKIGGGDPGRGQAGGIHWHMNIANQVEYIATDEARQVIPWVRLTDPDGNVTVYQTAGSELSQAQMDSAAPRRMDCIDCHNRPSHRYNAPTRAANLAIGTGRISTALPFVKRTAVELLTAEYVTTPEALQAIGDGLAETYGGQADSVVIAQAVTELQQIYQENFFPEMNVGWRAYPNNLGHTLFPGCYRCHDGKHQSADGNVISHECNSCHIILSQGSGPEPETISPEGMEFRHPVAIGEMWRQVNCSVCHTGGRT
jgi:nitrate/TMAO reductase-like tetraheme cytochrome c subunit